MRTLEAIFASLVLLATAAEIPVQVLAPKVFVDKGACPFECCQYGRWTADKPAPAYALPGQRKPAFFIPAGTAVVALSGYVRTRGQPFVVTRAHPPYQVGETLVVYTYYGEGEFLVWYKGRTFTEELGFSPYGGTGGTRCTDAKECWGTLSGELQSDWWINIGLQAGKTAWLHGAAEFSGADRCG